jgi:hypothetical protein
MEVQTVKLVSVAVDEDHEECVRTDFSMADVVQDATVPASATEQALPEDGTLKFANSAVSQDACKGAALTLTLSST